MGGSDTVNVIIAAHTYKFREGINFSASFAYPIIWLLYNLGYTTSKVDKVTEGGFQRNQCECELTDFRHFEGFLNHESKITRCKNVFFS